MSSPNIPMRTLSRSGEAAGRRRARGPYTERSAAPEISRSGGEPTGPLGSFDVFSLIVNKMIGTGSMQLQGGFIPRYDVSGRKETSVSPRIRGASTACPFRTRQQLTPDVAVFSAPVSVFILTGSKNLTLGLFGVGYFSSLIR